jgi:hypothetical protein
LKLRGWGWVELKVIGVGGKVGVRRFWGRVQIHKLKLVGTRFKSHEKV